MRKTRYEPTDVTVGAELEVFLMNPDGTLGQSAETVIKKLKERFGDAYTGEPSRWQLEILTDPHSNLFALLEQLENRYQAAVQVAAESGHLLLPVGTVFSPDDQIRIRQDDEYYQTLQEHYGEEFVQHWGHFNGTHIHVSSPEDPERNMRLFNMLRVLEPLAALMTTSAGYRGSMKEHNNRVNNLQHHELGWTHGEYLARPAPRMEDYDLHQETLKGRMLRAAEVISKQEEGRKLIVTKPERYSNRVAVRPNNDNKPVTTIELRVGDAAPPAYVAALATAVKGLARQEQRVEIEKDYRHEWEDDHALYEPGVLFEPSEARMTAMNKRWIRRGIPDAQVRTYTRKLLDFTLAGLEGDEHKLLQPFEDAWRAQQAPRDRYVQEAGVTPTGREKTYVGADARKMNRVAVGLPAEEKK